MCVSLKKDEFESWMLARLQAREVKVLEKRELDFEIATEFVKAIEASAAVSCKA